MKRARRLLKAAALPGYVLRSRRALAYARVRGAPGTDFGKFGKALGWRVVAKGSTRGLSYVVTPVNIVRYFEFAFAKDCLDSPSECGDVGSPRLFSLYVALRCEPRGILVLNPDQTDLAETRLFVDRLNIRAIQTLARGVDALEERPKTYDHIWSLSVLEHISGTEGDSDAIRTMYAALRPGGRLIVTVPVDRRFREEHREEAVYQAPSERVGEGYFFQRVYDEAALRSRLIEPVVAAPDRIGWFGERVPGRYKEYEKRWSRDGLACSASDAREIADWYRPYSSWDSMPGLGVCGLMIRKPA